MERDLLRRRLCWLPCRGGAEGALTALRLYPVAEAITIPFLARLIDDDGVLQPNEDQTAQAPLDELLRTSNALAALRGGQAGDG